MAKKKGWFIKGLPISSKWKFFIVITLLILLVLNNVLPNYINALNYAGRGWGSIGLVVLIVLFGVGSKISEGVIIGLSIFAIFSNFWDFFVRDYSPLRRQILIGSVVVLGVSLALGEISITNLISIVKNQLGVKRKH